MWSKAGTIEAGTPQYHTPHQGPIRGGGGIGGAVSKIPRALTDKGPQKLCRDGEAWGGGGRCVIFWWSPMPLIQGSVSIDTGAQWSNNEDFGNLNLPQSGTIYCFYWLKKQPSSHPLVSLFFASTSSNQRKPHVWCQLWLNHSHLSTLKSQLNLQRKRNVWRCCLKD